MERIKVAGTNIVEPSPHQPDRCIRNRDHLHRAIQYILDNPVKAELAATADARPFAGVVPETIRDMTGERNSVL